MFLVLYLGNQVQGIVFISFLFSVILSIVAWRACLITIKCNEYVHIIVDKRIVALYSPTGKALRTFNFSDIVDVRVVNLPQVMYAASIYNLILHTPKHVPIQPIQRFEVIPTALF